MHKNDATWKFSDTQVLKVSVLKLSWRLSRFVNPLPKNKSQILLKPQARTCSKCKAENKRRHKSLGSRKKATPRSSYLIKCN
jgi:hypothetical protein